VKAPLVDFRKGDVICSLGAAWSYPISYRAIDHARQLGARSFFLIYDVIPLTGSSVPEAARDVFRPHIEFVRTRADRIAFISESAKSDFLKVLPDPDMGRDVVGSAIGLPPGLSPASKVGELALPERIWSNRFVLMVGTIEERKDHLTVLKAWRELLQNYPAKDLPDLLCAGRLSWGSTSFIRELLENSELAKKIHIPEGPVSDTDLYRLYRDCEFTIFASRAEGWGLPITESLAFGKPVVAAAGSSLPEAGGDAAVYFEPGNYLQLSTIVERLNRDGDYFASVVSQIALRDLPTWADVTEHLRREIGVAHRTTAPGRNSGPPRLAIGIEYPLFLPMPFHSADEGSSFKRFADEHRRLPLTHQYPDTSAFVLGYLSFRPIGRLVPTGSGRQGPTMSSGAGIRLRFQLPSSGTFLLLACTSRSDTDDDGRVEIRGGMLHGSGETTPSSVVPVVLRNLSGDEAAEVEFTVSGSSSSQTRITLETFVLLPYDDEGSTNEASRTVQEMVSFAKEDAENLAKRVERWERRLEKIAGKQQQRRVKPSAIARRLRRQITKPRKANGTERGVARTAKKRVDPFPSVKASMPKKSQSMGQALFELEAQRARRRVLQREIGRLDREIHTAELNRTQS
jgi:glycosyltransferase involved in cell wall biosynthesis